MKFVFVCDIALSSEMSSEMIQDLWSGVFIYYYFCFLAVGEFRSVQIPDPSWVRFRPEIENSPDLKLGTLSGRARSGSALASSRFFKCRRDFSGFSENSPDPESEQLSGRDVTGSGLASSRFFKCRRDLRKASNAEILRDLNSPITSNQNDKVSQN